MEDPGGAELQLALNDKPAAKAYQEAMFQQGQPAAMFYTDDVQGDYERINTRIETMYLDKLDGRITGEFFDQRTAAWRH